MEKKLDAKQIKRTERKVRESFIQFLRELHSRELLTPITTWSSLYPLISGDDRFESMLSQTGSTALDLFKFYVEDLKSLYHEDRHTIKEILKKLDLVVDTKTSFDQFQKWVRANERSKKISIVNIRLYYNSLLDKAIEKEKEVERELIRLQKRTETAFWSLLHTIELQPSIDPDADWETLRDRIKDADAFIAVETEEQRIQFFKNYIKSISEACGHHHSSSSKRKRKKDKKERKRREEHEDSNSETISDHKRKKKNSVDEESERRKNEQYSFSPEVDSADEHMQRNS